MGNVSSLSRLVRRSMLFTRLDLIVRRLMIFVNFFSKGWGDPQLLKRMINTRRKLCQGHEFVPKDYPVYIDEELEGEDGIRILQGHFVSPFVNVMPGILPKAAEIARFQIVIPTEWKTDLKPMCIHLGRTGDHSFDTRRTQMAIPLLKEDGIGSIILENPFYGQRKPDYQIRSNICYVSDTLVMGAALVLESQVLFNWCDRMGYGPLGIHGMSLGGFYSAIMSCCWPRPLSVIPCMSWTTASVVYTEGPLKWSVAWEVLEKQYMEDDTYSTEIMAMLYSPEPSWKNKHKQLRHKNISSRLSENCRPDMSTQLTDKLTHLPVSPGTGSLPRPCQLPPLTPPVGRDTVHSNGTVVMLDGSASGALSIIVNNISTIPGRLSLRAIHGFLSNVKSLIAIVASGLRPSRLFRKQKSQLTMDCEHFLRGLLDECSHIGNYPTPVDPELAIIVVGDYDEYVPMGNVVGMDELWPGSEVRHIPHGHVSGTVSNSGQQMMRKAIRDSFQKQIDKYY